MSESSNGPEGLFNPKAALAELTQDGAPVYAPRLSFSERCGLAYTLAKGIIPQDTVRRAFGLSRATVSNLAQILKPGNDRLGAYPDVWLEYARKGEDDFIAAHYTPELHWRLKNANQNPNHTAAKPTGPDPRAAKYQGDHTLPDNSQWRIQWRADGWFFAPHPELNPWYGAERVRGAEGHEPFRTSAEAYDAAYALNGYDSPRPKPGRPKTKTK
jgi:hypothetical protein